MSNHELEIKARELRQLQSLIEEAEQEVETIKDAIKAHMGAQEELREEVMWKTIKSARIDAVGLRKALPDVAEAFTKVWPRAGIRV